MSVLAVVKQYGSPDQPRDPAGTPTGGQWSGGEGGGGSFESIKGGVFQKYGVTLISEKAGDASATALQVERALDGLAEASPVVAEKFIRGDFLQPLKVVITDGKIIQREHGGVALTYYSKDSNTITVAGDLHMKDTTAKPSVGTGAWVVGRDFHSVFAHEVGHAVSARIAILASEKGLVVGKDLYDSKPKDYWKKTVSGYSAKNNRELMAESFSAYTHPRYSEGKSLPREIVQVFEAAGVKSGTRKYAAPAVFRLHSTNIISILAHADAHGRVYEHEDDRPRCFADQGYYTEVKRTLDAQEERALRRLREVLMQARDALISRVLRRLPDLRGFRLKGMRDFRIAVRDLLERASARGGADARREVREGRKAAREYGSPDQPRDPAGTSTGGQWSGGGGGGGGGLRDYLKLMATHKLGSGGKYNNIEDYVLKNGQEFNATTKLPKGVHSAKRGLCYMNAYHLVLTRPNLMYAEGFATVHGVPLAHAWAVDKGGNVVDPTWFGRGKSDIGKPSYFGVKFSKSEVEKTIFARGKYGVLYNPEQGFPLLERGIALPSEYAYNPDQPRNPSGTETGGQWSGGGAGSDAKRLDDFIKHVETDPRVIEAERLNAELGDARDFPGVRDVNGNYTPQALAENKAIAESFLFDGALPPPGQVPLAVIMLGKPGAGKTAMLKQMEGLPSYIEVNQDAIKERIPGFTNQTASAYHERSSDIAKQNLIPAVVNGGYNAVFDASGKNPQKMEQLGKALKSSHGYDVLVLHAEVSDYTAAERVHARFLNGGRYMPVALAAKDYTMGPRESYAALQKVADEWRQYDTSSREPKIIHEGRRPGFVGVSFVGRYVWQGGEHREDRRFGRGAAGELDGDAADRRRSSQVGQSLNYAAPAVFRPRNAQAWMREKEFYITDLLDSQITESVRGVLVNGLKTGELNAVVADKIWTAFEPYLGDPSILRDGKPLAPHRLETIVRTNLTEAYNHGRMMEYTSEDMLPFLNAIRYSAILDERTTEVCAFLDGKLFTPEDPDLTDLLPPNHFNCRSIVVPVVVGEVVDQEDFITPEEVGRARMLADAKFLEQA